MSVAEGQPAPDFTLQSTDGSTVHLADLKGKTVVLYFYPKDDTPGCTTEACSFRDNMGRLTPLGVALYGISPDSVKSHVKFTNKFDLPFPLLADEGHTVAEAYGVWAEKSMYGRKYMGVERSTFIIDGEGIIRKIFPKVKVEGHTDEVIAAVKELAG
jgi:peroxiredoxin Q/BCP